MICLKAYVTVTKKSLTAVFLFTLFIIIVGGQFYAAAKPVINAKTNAGRVSFIKSLGLEPDDNNSQSKTVKVPICFSDVYKNYNALQKQAGYNLEMYKGLTVTVYTYPVGKISADNDDDYYVNIMVYKNRVIGGDISSRNFYGEMLPLRVLENGKRETG